MDAPNDLAMDSAGNAVLKLQVHLRHSVLREDGGVGDVTCVLVRQLSDLHRCSMPTVHPFADSSRWFNVRIAADSTMFLMVNLLIALSLGVHREQLEHLIGLTWPRPFLLRPLQNFVSPHCRPMPRMFNSVLGRPLLDHICGGEIGSASTSDLLK